MLSSLKKMRGDRRGWYKVSDLVEGLEIAVPRTSGGSQTLNSDPKSLTSSDVEWDEIVSIRSVGREHVYDIEVEGTHNFVGNGIFAHNTYVLKANTMLAVTGEVNASAFTVPVPTLPGSSTTPTASSTLLSEIPPEVLTADGTGVDLYKLATYNLAIEKLLETKVDGQGVRITSLETRVTALESGAISSASDSPITLSTSSLASAFEGLGALIQKGIAQFNTLVFRQLVASKDADGTSSAGSVTVISGNTVAQINNSLVKSSTKVFVTFNSQIAGSWWVSDKADGSFRVVLSAAQTADVSFDYFLVQTEGQLTDSAPRDGEASSTPSVIQSDGTADTVAPVVTLLGDNPMYLSIDGTFTEPGVSVTDNVDGSDAYITFINGIEQVISATTIDTSGPTTYEITYKAIDVAGNSATAIRRVIVGNPDGTVTTGGTQGSTLDTAPADTVPPVVTLNGSAAIELTVGDTFTDAGATATDDTDGDLTANIAVTGSVDTATEGSYSLTYSATDAAGNIGSASRMVTVVAAAPAAADPAPSTPAI